MNEHRPIFNEKSDHFKLHIHETPAPEREIERLPGEIEKLPSAKKRTVREILKDALKQLVVSVIIMAVGFLALNWSAYYKIAKDKWNDYIGVEQDSSLEQLAEIKKTPETSAELSSSSDPLIQKRQLPALDLEVAPLDNRVIIPRIDQNIPIIKVSSESLIKRNFGALEKEMQQALRSGVVHYPGTSLPGQTGNVVITGHSSYFPWDPGRFKDVFALLHKVVVGDKIIVYFEQDKYIYEISEIKIVLPEDIQVLKQTPGDQITLITCTPVGTNLKRLIVIAKPVAVNDKPITQKISR